MSQRRQPVRQRRRAPVRRPQRRMVVSRPLPRMRQVVPAVSQITPLQQSTLPVKSIARGEQIGEMIGNAIPLPFASKITKFLGGKLGHLIGAIGGFGDYQVKNNSLFFGGMDPPFIYNTVNSGGIVVRHREYLTDINATTAFTNQSFSLNPGLIGTFPWLSSVANAYEEYRFRGMIFEFKSMSSDAVLSSSTSSALGSVIMATEYNVLNANFTNKQSMENYEFANSSKPSCSFIHPIECKKSQTPITELFVRTGAIPSGSDQRLYDLGNFQIATVGMQAASGVCGELWCSYEVEFFKPRFNPINQGGEAGLADHFLTTTYTNALPLNGITRSPGSTLGCTSSNGTTIIMPSQVALNGTYMFIYQVSGSGAATIAHPTITITGGVLISAWTADTATFVANPANGVSSAVFNMCFIFQVQSLPSTVVLGTGGTLPSGTVNGDVYIIEIDSGIV